MKVKLLLPLVAMVATLGLSACDKSDQINYNLDRQANAFEIYRELTLVNLRSDKVLLEVEGYFAITNSTSNGAQKELSITIQTGPKQYLRHYCYIGGEVCYVVKQLENSHTDPYHHEIRMYWTWPDVILG